MKSLYESILTSTGSGMFQFDKSMISAYSTSKNFRKHFNMKTIRDEFSEDEVGISQSRLLGRILLKYKFTKKEVEPILAPIKPMHNAEGNIDELLKKVFAQYIKNGHEKKFTFSIYMGSDGKQLCIHEDELPFTSQTILWFK